MDYEFSSSVENITIYGNSNIANQPMPLTIYSINPTYELSNNLTLVQGPKLIIYRSIPATRYPFTYIGTSTIDDYVSWSEISPLSGPKITQYNIGVNGTLVYSFNYTGSGTPTINDIDVPLIKGSALKFIINSTIRSGSTVTVTVNIRYIDDGTNFGLSFRENYDQGSGYTFFNGGNSFVTNVQITTLNNIPLARNGYQFSDLGPPQQRSDLFASNTVIPTILPNTSLSNCFYKNLSFNSDISRWNVSNVTNMSSMFSGDPSVSGGDTMNFDQNISIWDTSNVTVMTNMFYNCKIFNQDIGSWDTSNVTKFSNMFFRCYRFNQYLSLWNTKSALNMDGMFANCSIFNNGDSGNNQSKPLTTNGDCWNTSLVTTMKIMFNSCSAFNQDISSWNTSSVRDMNSMFTGCTVFDQNLSTWDTLNVKNMSSMFYSCSAFNNGNIPLSYYSAGATPTLIGWNTQNVGTIIGTDDNNNPIYGSMASMFRECSAFNQDISGFNTINVRNMTFMFRQCSAFNQNLSSWDTQNLTNTGFMFYGCTNFNNGDTTNAQSKSLTTNGNKWNTSRVISMNAMFFECRNFNQNIEWTTSSVEIMSNMFNGCSIFNQILSSWNTSSVRDMTCMFNGCSAFNNGNIPLSYYSAGEPPILIGWNTQNVGLQIGTDDNNNPIYGSMESMFRQCSNFNQNISGFNTIYVRNMSNMFSGCSIFNQNLRNLETNSVTTMSGMFANCRQFNNINPASQLRWDTSNVTDMSNMFLNCVVFNSKLPWNVEKVTNISGMFSGCTIFNNNGNPDVSNSPMTSGLTSITGTSIWKWTSSLPSELPENFVYANWHNESGLTQLNAPIQLQGTTYWQP